MFHNGSKVAALLSPKTQARIPAFALFTAVHSQMSVFFYQQKFRFRLPRVTSGISDDSGAADKFEAACYTCVNDSIVIHSRSPFNATKTHTVDIKC